MKIECTIGEKEDFIYCIKTSDGCIGTLLINCEQYRSCRECLEKNIEWVIKDGEQDE